MKLDSRLASPVIPTTAMVGLGLLLLAFFLVISVFSAPRGLRLEFPEDGSPQLPEWSDAFLIKVNSETDVLLDCEPVRLDELETLLEREPDRPVILYSEPGASYQALVRVYDILRSAAVETIVWPTEREVREQIELHGFNPLEAPCGTIPLLPGMTGLTEPRRIEESYVEPEFPAAARSARLAGRVVLRALVTRAGAVGAIEVLQSGAKGAGFEESAIRAVEQWRYEPARRGDRAVDVYLTIVVEFSLD